MKKELQDEECESELEPSLAELDINDVEDVQVTSENNGEAQNPEAGSETKSQKSDQE